MAAGTAVEIKFDEAKLRGVQRTLRHIPNAMPRIMSRAVNRTTKSAKTETGRRISRAINITQSSVKKRILMTKATFSRWIGTLGISEKRFSLMHFKARQTKRGVTYKIEKTGARKRIPAAFIRSPRGVKVVFRRETPQTKRLPVIALKGPSLGVVFEQARGIARGITKAAHRNLEKNIDDQIKLALSKR